MCQPSALKQCTGLLSHYQPEVWEKKKVSLRQNHFEERQIPKQIHSLTNIAEEKHVHEKNTWVSSRQNQVSSTQNFKKPLLILCGEGKNCLQVQFISSFRLGTSGLPTWYPVIIMITSLLLVIKKTVYSSRNVSNMLVVENFNCSSDHVICWL